MIEMEKFFLGSYVGMDDVEYDGYYTVECNENGKPEYVKSFTITDSGESFDPTDATLEDVLTGQELAEEPAGK